MLLAVLLILHLTHNLWRTFQLTVRQNHQVGRAITTTLKFACPECLGESEHTALKASFPTEMGSRLWSRCVKIMPCRQHNMALINPAYETLTPIPDPCKEQPFLFTIGVLFQIYLEKHSRKRKEKQLWPNYQK